MLSPMTMTWLNLDNIEHISAGLKKRISHPLGENGVSVPCRPPPDMAFSRLSLSSHSGSNGPCRSREENLHRSEVLNSSNMLIASVMRWACSGLSMSTAPESDVGAMDGMTIVRVTVRSAFVVGRETGCTMSVTMIVVDVLNMTYTCATGIPKKEDKYRIDRYDEP